MVAEPTVEESTVKGPTRVKTTACKTVAVVDDMDSPEPPIAPPLVGELTTVATVGEPTAVATVGEPTAVATSSWG